MSLTQERINEIGRKVFAQHYNAVQNVFNAPSLKASQNVIDAMFDDFLSRIREGQEVAAEIIPVTGMWLHRYYPDGTRFFTIPPSAPCDDGYKEKYLLLSSQYVRDVENLEQGCSELVEALKELLSRVECDKDAQNWWPDAREAAHRALANHAKRMKE